jgi:DNA (cytosine-5)-methyltransferase 1
MGLDLGLESTGRFELLACVEIDPSFCETIRQNVSNGKVCGRPIVLQRDISKLSAEEFLAETGIDPLEVDVLIGGPPCQAFSTAGKRKAVEDPRGTLLWDFLRFVDALRPKMFVMENVRGLLSAALRHRPIARRPERGGPPLSPDEQAGSVVELFAKDLSGLDGIGYHLDCFEVNAVNYGAPQLRERAIFIGNRFNVEVEFPSPTHGPLDAGERDLFSHLGAWRTLRDVIGDLPADALPESDFSPRKKHFLSLVPPGSNWRALPVEMQKESMGKAWHAKGGRSGWWRRLNFDLPCPTLVTMPNHASTSLCHPTATRALTVQEYARIQEFPDGWEFAGTTAKKYAQIGNAVPTRLGRVAGDVVAKVLDDLRATDWCVQPVAPPSYRVVYLQSHVRTRQWFKDGEAIQWNDGAENGSASYRPPVTKRRVRKLGGRDG